MADRALGRIRRMLPAIASLAVMFAGDADGQVLLQLKPRVGDTLRMHVEQSSRITGWRGVSAAENAPAIVTVTQIFSRAVIEARSSAGTTLLAITDSVLVSGADASGKLTKARNDTRYRGQRTRVTVGFDGGFVTTEGEKLPKGLSEAAALIPATFPPAALKAGDVWVREMAIPVGTTPFGTAIAARVRAVFRVDSLVKSGQLAYISIDGALRNDADVSRTGAVIDDGYVRGVLVLDRGRGWLSESDVEIVARSTVGGAAALDGSPMHVTVRITQRMRLDGR